MVTRLLPEIGRWYAHRDKGEIFQVVAVDDHARVVEIQDVDGDVDEIELDAWSGLSFVAAEPREDARGSSDSEDVDLFSDDSDSEAVERDWRSPIDDLPAQPQEAIEADESDEFDGGTLRLG